MTLNDAFLMLKDAGIDNALGESRMLFARYSGKTPAELVDRSVECDSPALSSAVLRRCKREPLQYILGEVDFFREKYEVTPDVLIPRADTEVLVEYAVKSIPKEELFFDLCTGSGCIAISVLNNTSLTNACAYDVSNEALSVAEKNSEKNSVSDRLSLFNCDLLNNFPDEKDGIPYAILCNPPYIPKEVYGRLEKEIFFEPEGAFVGGNDGLVFYKRLLPLCIARIKDEGFVAFEIGYDQGDALRELACTAGCSCEILKDYSGNDRVAVIKKINC